MANDALRWVKRMFDYAIKREMINANPAAAFDMSDAGGKEDARDTQGNESQNETDAYSDYYS